jgi:hypothetical protein
MTPDSDDGFNLRKVRERARRKSASSSQPSVPPSPTRLNLSDEGDDGNLEPFCENIGESMSAATLAPTDTNGLRPTAQPVAGDEGFPFTVFTQAPMRDDHSNSPNDGELEGRKADVDGGEEDERGGDEDEGERRGEGDEDEDRAEEEDDSAFYRIMFPLNQGGAHYTGIPPYPGSPSEADRITEIRDEITGQWRPLPPGYCAPRRTEVDEIDAARLRRLAAEVHQHGETDPGDTPSGSDYSGDRRVKEKDRAKRQSRGKSTSDTEEEDDEDDREFAKDAVPDSNLSKRRRQLRQDSPPPRFTKAQKGKGRDRVDHAGAGQERGTHGGGGDGDTMVVDMDEQPNRSRQAVRGYSKEEIAEVDAFGCRVSEEAAQLAQKWGRKARDVLVRAGLGTRLSRRPNTYNEYRTWYASLHKDKKDPDSALFCGPRCYSNSPRFVVTSDPRAVESADDRTV